ncbi:MAG: hypothetical protein KME29_09660 [Calothrix sp. FI2-JRJ7]|nr:hypothetical protein [Calothrix sp. FI2-JRJ7]
MPALLTSHAVARVGARQSGKFHYAQIIVKSTQGIYVGVDMAKVERESINFKLPKSGVRSASSRCLRTQYNSYRFSYPRIAPYLGRCTRCIIECRSQAIPTRRRILAPKTKYSKWRQP